MDFVGWVSGSATHHEGLRLVGGATAYPPYKDCESVGLWVPRVVWSPCRRGLRSHGFPRRNPWHPEPTMSRPTPYYKDSSRSRWPCLVLAEVVPIGRVGGPLA